MADVGQQTFIIDCHICKAKVAAIESGRAERFYQDDTGYPYGERVYVGRCPSCSTILVGASDQIGFENFDSYEDEWSNPERVFPAPRKLFSSSRIPRVVTDSLNEAHRSLQAGANIAACVMLGRALEALCRDILEPKATGMESTSTKANKKLMLADGIKKLRDAKVIDNRLYDWSQQLHAFRNLAAHPEDISISREDAGDLQTFVNAIVEYVYDLADLYDEFKTRAEIRAKRKMP